MRKKFNIIPGWNKGIKHTNEHKKAISDGLRGHPTSEETKQKLKNAMLDRKKKFGCINSYQSRLKMSEAKKGKPCPHMQGCRCPFWKGGISSEPYSVNWKETLKRSIRERDKYVCQICGNPSANKVHHIDYNKKNSNPTNLITLCQSCHSKTNFRRRYWTKFFLKELLPE